MSSNLPSIRANLPPTTALDVSSMQPSEIARHRAEISVSVEVVLTGFWRDSMPDAMRAAVLADWCDELEGWPIESIRAALRKRRRDHPDKKMNPGHILAILNDAWGRKNAEQVRAVLAKPDPEPRNRPTKEQAIEILAAAGFGPRKIENGATKNQQEGDAE